MLIVKMYSNNIISRLYLWLDTQDWARCYYDEYNEHGEEYICIQYADTDITEDQIISLLNKHGLQDVKVKLVKYKGGVYYACGY